MNTKTAVIGAALLSAAAASPAFAQAKTTPGGQYSLLGGTTVPSGTNVVSGEFGWPSATFGFTHGLSGNTDVGFKWPIGLTVGYSARPDLDVAFGVELPMTLVVTPSPVQMLLGPMFGPALEYHVDRQLAIGFNTRFGPLFSTRGGGGQFGFITQMMLAYRL